MSYSGGNRIYALNECVSDEKRVVSKYLQCKILICYAFIVYTEPWFCGFLELSHWLGRMQSG